MTVGFRRGNGERGKGEEGEDGERTVKWYKCASNGNILIVFRGAAITRVAERSDNISEQPRGIEIAIREKINVEIWGDIKYQAWLHSLSR